MFSGCRRHWLATAVLFACTAAWASATATGNLHQVDFAVLCHDEHQVCEDAWQFEKRVNAWRAMVAAVPGFCVEAAGSPQTLFVPKYALSATSGRVATAWMQTEATVATITWKTDDCSDGKDCSGTRYPSTHPNFLQAKARMTQVLRITCLSNDSATLHERMPHYDPAGGDGFRAPIASVPLLSLVAPGPWQVVPSPDTSAATKRKLDLARTLMRVLAGTSEASPSDLGTTANYCASVLVMVAVTTCVAMCVFRTLEAVGVR